MTELDRKKFIIKVKGKKIRWTSWISNEYFIPDGHYIGNKFSGINSIGKTISWNMNKGFDIFNGHNWEWFDKSINNNIDLTKSEVIEPVKHKCVCNFERIIMVTGCICEGS